MKSYKDEQIVIITTGSQGEAMAALSRMAANIHKKVTIKPGDLVIFSSSAIPGNEKNIFKVINELSMIGAKVIFQDAHVSGHACKEEIKLIYSLVKPKYAIPVHGEYHMLVKHARLAGELGMPKENIFVSENGQILEFTRDNGTIAGKVNAGMIMVDGLGVGDVGNIVLRDRRQLSQDGILIVVVTMNKNNGRVIAGPDIVSRGFVYVRESEELLSDVRSRVRRAIEACEDGNITEWSAIKTSVRDALARFIFDRTRRRPMILPIIMEA